MVQGLAFLSKKSWHVKNLSNQSKVWQAEQRAQQEKQKAHELAQQIRQEREREEFQKLAGNAGTTVADRGIDWMYQGGNPNSEIAQQDAAQQREEYLLGKAYEGDKSLFDRQPTGDIASAAADAAQSAQPWQQQGKEQDNPTTTTTESQVVWTESSVAERNEAFRVRLEDPMFAVAQRAKQDRDKRRQQERLRERVQQQPPPRYLTRDEPNRDDASFHDDDDDKAFERRRRRRRREGGYSDNDDDERDGRRARKYRRREPEPRRRRRRDGSDDDEDSSSERDEERRRRRRDRERYRDDDRRRDDRRYKRGNEERSTRRWKDDDGEQRRRRDREDDDDYRVDRHEDRAGRSGEPRRRRREREAAEESSSWRDRRADDDAKPRSFASRRRDEPRRHLDDARESKAYGLQPRGDHTTGKPLDIADLGPDPELLRRKREAAQKDRPVSNRPVRSDRERAAALAAMEYDAQRHHALRQGTRDTSDDDNNNHNAAGRRPDFLHQISRDVHGVSGQRSYSLEERMSQNRGTRQRRTEGFL